MERNFQQRSKSLKKSSPQKSGLNLDQILKNINPLNKQAIELEDMKRILHRLPEESRAIVQKIFHSHIFNTKSFILDVSEFCRLFNQVEGKEKSYGENQYRTNNNKTRTYPAKMANDCVSKNCSQYMDDKSEFGPEKNISPNYSFYRTPKSKSPIRNPKSQTYSQIYKEKKEAPISRKMPEKLQVNYSDTKETSDHSPLQKSLEAFSTSHTFKECYSNVQELIDIRKAYFLQTSKKLG